MSDESNTNTSANPAAPESAENTAPGIQVVAQYIKDLSFENPISPINADIRPQIELNVDLQARQADNQKDLYEVEMKIRATATHNSKPAFLVELAYGSLFHLHNIPDDVRQQILMIEAPHIMFPFVRRIVSDVIRDGGLPTLMIEPIDFAALYRAKMAEMHAQGQAPAPVGQA